MDRAIAKKALEVLALIDYWFDLGQAMTFLELKTKIEQYCQRQIVIDQHPLKPGIDAVTLAEDDKQYRILAKSSIDLLPILHEFAHILRGDLRDKGYVKRGSTLEELLSSGSVVCRKFNKDDELRQNEQEVEFIARRLLKVLDINRVLDGWF